MSSVKQRIKIILTVVMLMIATAIILWLPPSRLKPNLGQFTPGISSVSSETDKFEKFMSAQHDQVRSEILERIKFENEWFHYKFLILGGIIGGSLGAAGLSAKLNRDFKTLHGFLKSREFMFILALSSLVCLTIDIHVRRNLLVVNQLGTWLACYWEPMMTGRTFDPTDFAGFHGWESFLRLDNGQEVTGMHTSSLYSLLFWPPLHLTTLLPLGAYCFLFGYRRTTSRPMGKKKMFLLDLIIFRTVVLALVFFALMSRALPEAFELQLFPLPRTWPLSGLWVSPLVSSVITAGFACLFLLIPKFYRPHSDK